MTNMSVDKERLFVRFTELFSVATGAHSRWNIESEAASIDSSFRVSCNIEGKGKEIRQMFLAEEADEVLSQKSLRHSVSMDCVYRRHLLRFVPST